PEAADLRRRPAGDGRTLQFVRDGGRRRRLQEADAAPQDRETAVLRGLGDADPARHADGSAHQHQWRGDGYPRRGHPGPLLRGRVTGWLCPARPCALPHLRTRRRASRGGPDGLRHAGSSVVMATHSTTIELSEPAPAEVAAGTELVLKLKL